jgi:Ca-activated chloride channel family protein
MQRWHLTAGLAGLAVVGALLAPRLTGWVAPQPPEPQPVEPQVEPPVPVAEIPTEAEGHLAVQARLDRDAVLRGQTQERFLAITISAPDDIGESFRRPVDIGVVMDASGSMAARGKIDYAKRAAKLLATSMETKDVYSLVTFSDDATVIVPATAVNDAYPIHHAVDGIREGGGTNLYAGLDKGASEVRRSLDDRSVGRIVLLSDGNANVGVTDPSALGRYVSTLASQGVTVSTVGLGLDYNEDLLARLADLGGGTYDFVDDPRELAGVFSDELERSASVVARGTQITIELPEGVRGMEVIGWDATPTVNGWTVWMGDIYAGDARKIIARVQVTGAQQDVMPVAAISARYNDIVDGRAAASTATANATTTTQVAQVEASLDEKVAVEAVRAWGNEFLVESTRAYTDGDVEEAKKLAGRSRDILDEAAIEYDNDTLRGDAANTRQQIGVYGAYAPTSAEGRRSVKATKEMYNEQSRAVIE